MRRRDKEITDKGELEEIIAKSNVCRLAMCDGDKPYIVPLCFGKKGNCLYFHSARKGKKIDILKKNPSVCFEFEIFAQVIKSAEACKWGMKFRSVIGYGKAEFIENDAQKIKAFDIIMNQYGESSPVYEEKPLKAATIIRVEIESMTGKHSNI